MGGCDGVVGTGGGGGPGGFLVVLFRGGARGVGARADVDPRVCAHGLRLGVGRGLSAAAVVGHALYVGCHRGLGGGAGTLLADPGVVLAWSGAVRGPGVRALRGGRTRCVVLRPRRAPL